MTKIPFCALETFSLMHLLKSNFWCRCKPKCFWETLHSTGTSLKKTWAWKGFTVFREKNYFSRLFGKIKVEHHFPLICPFRDSLQIIINFFSGNINVITIQKIDVSSAKSLTFDMKFFGKSFIYIKNSNGLKLDSCGTPALTSSQWEFCPWSKTFYIYYPKNFENVLVSY